jgi:DNA invertase Pin-like site-specific DNA recombinase
MELDNAKRVRVIIYARVSTDDPRQAGSCDNQVSRCEKYCEIYGYQVVARFKEEGVSAKTMNRPKWNQVVELLENDQADMVISTALDRMSRNVEDFLRFCREVLDRHEKSFTTLQEHIDTTIAAGRMMLTMLLAFGQFMREQTQEKVSAVRKARTEQGYLTTFPPFGAMKCEVKGVPVKDPERWPWVERIFKWAAEGKTNGEIIELLSSRGVTTPRGAKVTQTTLSRILSSRFYLGEVEYDGTWYKAKHQCVIDKKLWQSAQRVRKAKPGPRPQSYTYLLENLIVTSHFEISHPKNRAGNKCPYHVRHVRNRHGTVYPEYVRADVLRKVGGVQVMALDEEAESLPAYIRADKLDEKVVAWLIDNSNRGELKRALKQSVKNVLSRKSVITTDLAAVEKELTRLRRSEAKLKGKVLKLVEQDQLAAMAVLNDELEKTASRIRELELSAETLEAAHTRIKVAAEDEKSTLNHVDLLKKAWESRDYAAMQVLMGVIVQQVDIRVDGISVTLYALPGARVYELGVKVAPTGVEPVPPP